MSALLDAGHEVSLISGQRSGWSNDLDRVWTENRLTHNISVPYGPGASVHHRLPQLIKRCGARAILRYTPLNSVKLAIYGNHDSTPSLTAAALRTPADLYIAHYVAALPAAAAAARHHNTLYAYDAEDFHIGDWPNDPVYAVERKLVRSIEGRYLQGCAYISAASPMIADALVETYHIDRPQVVLNVFPLAQAPEAPSVSGCAKPGPSLYWFSQTIGADRGLECAVRAISQSIHRPHLYLRGTPATGFVAQLEELAIRVGAADRVHILPPAEPERMERLASKFDLGLASEVGCSRNREICLSNKLFSFILAGLPPLLSDTLAQRQFASETDLLDLVYPVNNAPALTNLIDGLLGDPARLAAIREKVWRLGLNQYHWEREGEIIKCLAEQALSR